MRGKRKQEGYLLIENRFAPTLSAEESVRTAGEVLAGAGVRGVYESATITCAHCQKIVILNPLRTREREYCRKCDHYVCDGPGCNAGCNPFVKILDDEQERLIKQEQVRMVEDTLPNLGLQFQSSLYYDRSVKKLLDWDVSGALSDAEVAVAGTPTSEHVWQRAVCLMLSGNWERGWKDFRRGLDSHPHGYKDAPRHREWDGKPGARVLIMAEQGIGDTIQMSRYFPLVVERSIYAGILCHESLGSLFANTSGLRIDSPSDETEYDAWVYTTSLPGLFGATPEKVESPLSSLRELAMSTPCQLPEGPKIGVCWRGDPKTPHDKYRSARKAVMQPIYGLGTQVYEFDLGTLFGQTLRDWRATAAYLARMDAVVSVDTAVAHLAATLGVPTHLLLSRHPEWRWPLGQTSSPWYSSLQVHWQKAPGDWSNPVESAAASLQHLKG